VFISKLELRNFRCFKETKIDGLGPLNFFGGRNYSGKSTVLDAISFALTGTCRGAETGRGLDELRTQIDGERADSRAFVAMHFIHDKTGMFQRREDEGPRAIIQKQVDRLLGIPAATIRACLYAGEILRLPRKEAGALLQALLPTQNIAVPLPVSSAFERLVGMPCPGVADLSAIEGLYKRAYDRRLELGRQLKDLGHPKKPLRPDFLVGEDDPTEVRAIVKGKLQTIRKERDGALLEWQTSSSAAASVAADEARLRGDLARVQAMLDKTPKPSEIHDLGAKLLEDLSYREALNKEIEENLARLRRELGAQEGAVAFGKKRLDDLKKAAGECPVCDTKLTPLKKRTLESTITNSIEAAGREAQKIRLELEAVTEPRSLGEITRKIADIEAMEQKYVGLVETKKEIEERLAAMPESGALHERPDTALLDERISVGEGRLQALDTYIAQMGGFEKLTEKYHQLKAAGDELNELVYALGPDGIRTELAGSEDLAAFQAGIRDDMAAMGFTIDLTPLLQVEEDPKVNGRPARMLSASEGILFSMAFACAVAKWSKLGIVCVDAWDTLDEETTLAAGRVLAANASLQRFVFVTPKKGIEAYRASAMEKNKADSPTRFYLIEKGENGSVVTLPKAKGTARAKDVMEAMP